MMGRLWSRSLGVTEMNGLDYWEYFGARLVDNTGVQEGEWLLDVGCGTGSSLFPAAEIIGKHGYAVGIDICPG